MNYDQNTCKTKPAEVSRPAPERHLVTILSGIYLDAGLPLEAAVRSAIADYQCNFHHIDESPTVSSFFEK